MHWRVRILHAGLRLAARLPLRILHALGAAIGDLIWAGNGRSRRIVERNLSLVTTQNGDQKRHEIAHQALRETGKALTEVAKIWGSQPDRVLELVRDVRGAEHLDRALAAPRGLLIAGPHLGCWEILNRWMAARTPMAILYRAPRHLALEPLLVHARAGLNVEQVRADASGVRKLYKRLAAGGTVGILPDQKPRQGDGVLAPFFGMPASTMVLLPRLAARTGAAVLFAFAERLPRGAGYRMHFVPAPAEIADADLTVACAALNRGVEHCVQLAFEQYQWTYKRWPESATAVNR